MMSKLNNFCALSSILILILSSCATKISVIPEPSGEWLPIGENHDKNIISIDGQNYTKKDNKATLWVRVDYRTPPKPQLNATQFYAEFDCDHKSFIVHRQMELDTQGERLEDKSEETPANKAASGSTEYLVLENVCFEEKTELELSSENEGL